MYKIIRDEFSNSENTIHKISTNTFISAFSGSEGWEQFVEDIFTNGIGIVEGADYVGVTTYTDARRAEYPSIEDQLDKIYHSGINAWKADIKKIKDKYPKTQVGITSIAPIPDWVKTILFDKQKEKYVEAKTRLEQYELSAGLKDENGEYIIEPLPLYVQGVGRNILIVKDEKEREAALKIVNETPRAVIDSINN